MTKKQIQAIQKSHNIDKIRKYERVNGMALLSQLLNKELDKIDSKLYLRPMTVLFKWLYKPFFKMLERTNQEINLPTNNGAFKNDK